MVSVDCSTKMRCVATHSKKRGYELKKNMYRAQNKTAMYLNMAVFMFREKIMSYSYPPPVFATFNAVHGHFTYIIFFCQLLNGNFS